MTASKPCDLGPALSERPAYSLSSEACLTPRITREQRRLNLKDSLIASRVHPLVMTAPEKRGEASRAAAALPSGGITPGISGAHRPLNLRGTLSARPLHAVVRFRLPLARRCRRAQPRLFEAAAAPGGEQTTTTGNSRRRRRDEIMRAATGATYGRIITEQG